MTNTNVINNANTNVNNNVMEKQVMMIGEELLDVQQLDEATYIVYGTTCSSVRMYIKQVVGEYIGNVRLSVCDTHDVLVELVCVDNAEELAMQAEAAYLAYYEGSSVDTDVDYLAYYEGGVNIEFDLELGF